MKSFPDIKGFQETTLIDWDGKIASIIFLGGCNFRCPFCHSSSLVTGINSPESIPFENIASFLKAKKGWIDGVVITGGEPTLDEEGLFNLIGAIKNLSFLVKLDTNGARPKVLKKILDSRMIDYVAMDIKAPLSLEDYARASGAKVNIEEIIESKDTILGSEIDYEFRTTLVPGIVGISDIAEIAKSIVPAKKYCLQQFVPRDPIDSSFLNIRPYPTEELNRIATVASEHLANVIVRKN